MRRVLFIVGVLEALGRNITVVDGARSGIQMLGKFAVNVKLLLYYLLIATISCFEMKKNIYYDNNTVKLHCDAH